MLSFRCWRKPAVAESLHETITIPYNLYAQNPESPFGLKVGLDWSCQYVIGLVSTSGDGRTHRLLPISAELPEFRGAQENVKLQIEGNVARHASAVSLHDAIRNDYNEIIDESRVRPAIRSLYIHLPVYSYANISPAPSMHASPSHVHVSGRSGDTTFSHVHASGQSGHTGLSHVQTNPSSEHTRSISTDSFSWFPYPSTFNPR